MAHGQCRSTSRYAISLLLDKEGQRKLIKAVYLLKRKEGLSREEFFRYWREVHGPLAKKHFPWYKNYVQNHIIAASGEEPAFDGIVEVWYGDMHDYQLGRQFYSSDAGKVIRDDEGRFMDVGKRMRFVVEEVPMMGI